MITENILRKLTPGISEKEVKKFSSQLNALILDSEINTPVRVAHFLTQLCVQTDLLSSFREKGKDKYKRRGFISGELMYKLLSEITQDEKLIEKPSSLDNTKLCLSAMVRLWSHLRLNEISDKDDLRSITYRLTGNFDNMELRRQILLKTKKALSV